MDLEKFFAFQEAHIETLDDEIVKRREVIRQKVEAARKAVYKEDKANLRIANLVRLIGYVQMWEDDEFADVAEFIIATEPDYPTTAQLEVTGYLREQLKGDSDSLELCISDKEGAVGIPIDPQIYKGWRNKEDIMIPYGLPDKRLDVTSLPQRLTLNVSLSFEGGPHLIVWDREGVYHYDEQQPE